MTLFEMKEKMAELRASIAQDAAWIAEKAADPAVEMKEITAKKEHRDELQVRLDLIKAEHDALEAKQRESVKQTAKMSEKDRMTEQKATFYRDALNGKVGKSYEGLGAIPASNSDLGTGDKLLPTNMSRELLMEPVESDPLREVARVTNITGLEEPKLGYTIEDADIADVTDKQTAKEIELEGDTVTYGRMKMKVSATVKDTVYHGAAVDVVSAIEPVIRSALAKREKYYAFQTADSISTNSDTAHAHMSFYAEDTGVTLIKTITGVTLYDAIKNALADLPDEFSSNAKVMMRRADYYDIIGDLANSAESLFGNKPASILGYPVVFCDKAVTPVVGDFSFYGINYDIGAVYETDKDAKKGEYYFVLTAWGDQQIRLRSAFRLAAVDENP